MRRAAALVSAAAVLLAAPAGAAAARRVGEVRVPDRTALRRLVALGLDTGEVVTHGRVAVVLHGARDARRLRAAGFVLRAPLRPRPRARAAAAALPSGRTSYRTLADYAADLRQLAAAHPGLVRLVVLPGASVQGRPLEGVEIASDVDRTDDGRPTVVEVGLHHAREWSSGEVVMEHAFDLVQGYGTDARITRLVDGVRTVVLPVMNPDGLVATLAVPAAVGDPGTGTGSYRRKNCAGGVAGTCGAGVDLNRNYGAFWGGPGASDDPSSETYRGPAPFSEPEARALHAFSSTRQIVVLNSVHNYGRTVLYQPGFSREDEPGVPHGAALPYAERMAALARAMASAAGYAAGPASELYATDTTGATEDWNYFTQGTFGFTTEVGAGGFHPPYASAVVAEWPGVRELLLRAGEAALDPASHAAIVGTAPAGATLRLTRDVATSTSYVLTGTESADPLRGPAFSLPEHLGSTLTVPAGGRFTWAVNPSTRPVALLAHTTEAWTLTCERGGTVRETRRVVVGLGQTRREHLACGERPRLRIRAVHRAGRRLTVRVAVTGGRLTGLRLTLRDRRGRLRAAVHRRRVPARVTLRAGRLPGGRYVLRASARTPGGHAVRASHALRVRG